MKKEIIEILSNLVKIKSTEDNILEKYKAIEFVQNYLSELDIKVDIIKHPESPYLLASIPGQIDKNFLMVVHVDVVNGDENLFELKKEGDILKGRGVYDNKGPVAMALVLIKNILQDKNSKYPNIQLLVTSDEETGGKQSTTIMMEQGKFKHIEAVFIPDGGAEDFIVCKQKGIMQVILESKGKAAHGSMPWKGENAIEKIYEVFLDIKNEFIKFEKDSSDQEKWYPTVNLGYLKGGNATNQVPSKAIIGLDIRFTEPHTLDSMKKLLKEIINNRVDIVDINGDEMLNSKEDFDEIIKYKEIMEKIFNNKIRFEKEHGGSDARIFSDLNIPVWLQNPKGGGPHSENEWVNLDSIEKMTKGLQEYLTKFE